MRLLLALAALLAAFATSAPGDAAASAPRTVAVVHGDLGETLDRQLTDAATSRGFGGALVVEIDGKLVIEGGWGLANRETGVAFTADTPAQVGSITKTFTGLLASQLIAEGKLDPDAPLRRYLPDAPEPVASATINALLTHSSGLSDYCGDDFDPRPRATLISECGARPLEFPVGSSHYSNMGVSFVAAAMEEITGKPWEESLRERIWTPFGMNDTGWTFPGRRSADFAVGYLNDQSQRVISDRIAALHGADWNLKGNGGIQASAADMLKLFHGLMAQPAAVRAVQLVSHADGDAPEVKEGYGLFFRLDAQGKPYRVGHGGSDGTFFAYFAWYPQQNAFVYFVGNNGEDPVKNELRGVLKAVQVELGITPATPPNQPAAPAGS
jgi:CubicO group peptidase (beta-lactamase class C family)